MVVGVRHAAVWNPEGVVYARLPGFHLSESGRAEAEQLSQDLSSVGVASIQASPLERAVETARILAEPHGLDGDQVDGVYRCRAASLCSSLALPVGRPSRQLHWRHSPAATSPRLNLWSPWGRSLWWLGPSRRRQ